MTPTTKRKRVRKPKPFTILGEWYAWIEPDNDCGYSIEVARTGLYHVQARRLARWLERAAEWVEDGKP